MGEHNAKPTSEDKGVVVGDNKRHAVFIKGRGGAKSGSRRKLWLGVIVLVLGSAGGYIFVNNRPEPLATKTPQQAVSDITNQVANSKKDPAVLQAAQDELTRREAEANNKADKQLFASEAINLYQQAGKLDDAHARAQKAEEMYKSALTAAMLAGVYRAEGDYANAAKYYGIASDRSPQSPPTKRSPYNDYRLMKEEMERQL